MWPSGALPSPPGTGWRHRLRRVFLAGLLILAPVALTVFVLVQLFQVMDGIFAPLVDRVLATALGRDVVRIPGLGLLLTLCVVLLLGWLSTHVGGRRLLRWMENVIQRIPVAKSIYNATKGILEAVSRDQADAFKRVILIEYPKKDIFALAFVTAGARWGHVDERLGDLLLVFVPTTPNPTSGFLLLVPRGEAIELPISVEEGVRMVISGGILLPRPHGIDPATFRPGDDTGLAATPEPRTAPAAGPSAGDASGPAAGPGSGTSSGTGPGTGSGTGSGTSSGTGPAAAPESEARRPVEGVPR